MYTSPSHCSYFTLSNAYYYYEVISEIKMHIMCTKIVCQKFL